MLRLVPQHRHRQRGVQRLMLAGQAGQGEVQFALAIAIAQLALAHDRVPMQPARLPDRPDVVRDLADPVRRSAAGIAG